jgi:hypothetical protein
MLQHPDGGIRRPMIAIYRHCGDAAEVVYSACAGL